MAYIRMSAPFDKDIDEYFLDATKIYLKKNDITSFKQSSGGVVSIGDYITITNNVSNYTWGTSIGALAYIDLTHIQALACIASRENTSGRVYIFASSVNPMDIPASQSMGTVDGAVTYFDTNAKGEHSLNVSSLTGYYYIGISNNGSNSTYLYELGLVKQ